MELELKGALADAEILGELNLTDFFRRAEKLVETDLLPPLQFVQGAAAQAKVFEMIKKRSGDDDAGASSAKKRVVPTSALFALDALSSAAVGTDDADFLLETDDAHDNATAVAASDAAR
jgi:hypothetical protein